MDTARGETATTIVSHSPRAAPLPGEAGKLLVERILRRVR